MTVEFGTGQTCVTSRWTAFKAICKSKGLRMQFEDEGEYYQVFAFDGSCLVYSCQVFKDCQADSDTSYTASDAQVDQVDFETNFKSTANKTVEPRTDDGRRRVTQEKSTVSRVTFYTHNWCDPTTWYTNSRLIVTESVSFSSGSYQLSHANVIDTYHGKLTGEDFLRDVSNNSFRIAAFSSGTLIKERDPHYGVGGDYVIDYVEGKLLPTTGDAFTGSITVTYHYATDSTFVVKPLSGKNLIIASAEVQFSDDIDLCDSVSFQPYGDVATFAPQYCPIPYPPGTLIPLGAPVRYKTMLDYYNESMRSYPTYPMLGGDSWRGVNRPSVVLDWDYVSAQTLYSTTKMQVNIKLDHDVPFSGSFATATFYCISQDI